MSNAANDVPKKRLRVEREDDPRTRFPLGCLMLIVDARACKKNGLSTSSVITLIEGHVPDWLLWELSGRKRNKFDDDRVFFNVRFDKEDMGGVHMIIDETLSYEAKLQRANELEKFVDDVTNEKLPDDLYYAFTDKPLDFVMTVV